MFRNLLLAARNLVLTGFVAVVAVSGAWAGVRTLQGRQLLPSDLSFWLFAAGAVLIGLGALTYQPMEAEGMAFQAKVLTGAQIDDSVLARDSRFRLRYVWYLGGAALVCWAASAGVYFLA